MRRLRNLPRLLMAGLVLLLGIAQPTLSEVFCVDTALGLQNALSTAAVNGQDDEVWTIQGTYIGNFDYASTQANKLRVLGGYTAGCAGRVLDPANTLLDGHQTNTVLVLSAPDVAAEFLVEGLTLRHGQRTGEGGGLYAKVLGAVTVNRNRIENNMAGANSDGNGGEGGGASISATTVTLTHNSITGNATSGFFDGDGGGVAISATTATLTDNSITGNSSFRDAYYSSSLGGGVSIYATTATLTNNSIMGNGASLGGGAHIYATTATLIQNSITGNVGGGIYTGVMNTSAGTATTLNHNSITGNTGGGASISADTVTPTNNRIMSNTAKMDWRGEGDGGGASISAITATLINNNITGNTARMGGGLDLSLGDTETHDAARLYNNLFWDNVANANEGSDLLIDNDRDGDYLPTPVILLANNFDQAQPSGFSITLPITLDPTNLNQPDPLFVDASAGNFHLQPGSPMVDAGYPGTPDLPDFDIEGTPRVLGAAVDIGAYEYDDGSNAKAILSIARAGNGSGQVTSNPSGIACGSDCFHIYDIDTLEAG